MTIKTTTIKRHLPVKLTAEEMHLKAKELTDLLQAIEQVKEEKKAANADFKARLEELEAKAWTVARDHRRGEEDRPTECFERISLEARVWETYRTDTGEMVGSRPMTTAEVEEAKQLDFVRDEVEASMGTRLSDDDLHRVAAKVAQEQGA